MKIIQFLILFSIIQIFPAIGKQSNFSIIDSLIKEHLIEIKPEILNEKKRCFNLETNSTEIDFLIENSLLEDFPEFSFHRNRENQCPKLKINTNNVSVNYSLLNDDNVIRTILVELSSIVENKDQPLKLINNKKLIFSDTIKINDINNLQKSTHSFDKGDIPKEESTFYDNYLQPIIFVGTAIITIAILFTVRSN